MPDTELLQMALIGYEAERQNIQEKIDEIKGRLSGRRGRAIPTLSDGSSPAKPAGRQMSAAAKRRIAAAQKLRWVEYRKKQKAF